MLEMRMHSWFQDWCWIIWILTLSNFFPLSVIMLLRMPNLQTIAPHMKLVVFLSMMVAKTLASTYFVKKFMTTITILSFPFTIRSGPIISTPHWAKGHVLVMKVSFTCGWCGIGEEHWHLLHLLTNFIVSSYKVCGYGFAAIMIHICLHKSSSSYNQLLQRWDISNMRQ